MCGVGRPGVCGEALSLKTASAHILYNPIVVYFNSGRHCCHFRCDHRFRRPVQRLGSEPGHHPRVRFRSPAAAPGTRLLLSQSSNLVNDAEGALANNPGLANAAAQGLAYNGPG